MPRELRPLFRALGLRPTTLAGRPAWRGDGFVAATVGVGPERAYRETGRILDACGARGVLLIGVAGACDPTLEIADVVAPATVVDAGDGTVFQPQPFLVGAAETGRAGVLATVARIGSPTPAGARAVDMETAAVAAACVARGIPWDVRRAVSDLPGGLPATIGSLLRPDGRADPRAVARMLVRHPTDGLALIRLGRDTGRAVRAVTAAALAALGANR